MVKFFVSTFVFVLRGSMAAEKEGHVSIIMLDERVGERKDEMLGELFGEHWVARLGEGLVKYLDVRCCVIC
jgi:hypothetical protein